jgi:adenosylcobinamide-phosphate synthase
VRWIGNLISAVQRIIRRYCHSDRALRIGGAVMWLVVVGLTWAASWGAGTGKLHPWLAGVEVWMIFTVLAGRCLANAAQDVERPYGPVTLPKVGKNCRG